MDDKISYYKIHDLNLIGKMDNGVCQDSCRLGSQTY